MNREPQNEAEQLEQLLAAIRESRGGVRNEELARELGRLSALLEMRQAEAEKLRGEEAALERDVRNWQAKAAAIARELEQQAALETGLRASVERLEKEAARLGAIQKDYAAENDILQARAAAGEAESAGLRRLAAELKGSLSWKITAPLRFFAKPLFRTPQAAEPAPAAPEPRAAAPSTPDVFAKILPALRSAQSIAIIPCAIPFSSTLNQRPIACARYLADHGTTVIYVGWQWSPDEAVPQAGEEVYPRIFCLPLYPFQDHTGRILEASRAPGTYLCTLPSDGLVSVVRPLRAAGFHIHYDIMDDWEEFHRGGEAPWFSVALEHEMVILSDTVTAVSDRLARKFAGLRSDIAVVRNGYQPAALNCEQFLTARSPLEHPKIVGYFGHFSDAWFDWDTVFYAAQKMPEVVFELIGWGVSDATRARMNGVPNIRFAGIVPQKDLHRYAGKWWAGMIPFRPSAVSAAVDPLKIYEYLHFGLPSVVTGISGIANYPLVHFAADAESFVAALRAIPDRPDEQTLTETGKFLKACVWDERFAILSRMLGESALVSLYRSAPPVPRPPRSETPVATRICFASVGATSGGVERVFLNRSEALLRRYSGLEIEVFFYQDWGGAALFARYAEARGLDRLKLVRTFDPSRYQAIFPVDTPQLLTDYPAILDQAFLECHTPYAENRRYLQEWHSRLKTLIVPSEAFQRIVEEECPGLRGKIRVIRDFVPQLPATETARALPAWRAPLFLYFGRIDRNKNLAEFIEAISYIRHQLRQDALGIICGQIDPAYPLLEAIETHRARGSIAVLPPVPFENGPALLQLMRQKRAVLVSCSKGESFGLSVAEAMTAGMPVVISNIAPHAALVAGREKFLYSLGNPRELAAKMISAAEHYDELAAECLDLSRSFAEDAFIADWESLFPAPKRT